MWGGPIWIIERQLILTEWTIDLLSIRLLINCIPCKPQDRLGSTVLRKRMHESISVAKNHRMAVLFRVILLPLSPPQFEGSFVNGR